MKQRSRQTALPASPRVSRFSLRQRRRQIELICRRIATGFQPLRIILFGSYVCGKVMYEADPVFGLPV